MFIFYQERRPKREAITILKTYEEAEDICLNAFQNSQSYQTCKEYISDLSNTSIVNCISDVMVSSLSTTSVDKKNKNEKNEKKNYDQYRNTQKKLMY